MSKKICIAFTIILLMAIILVYDITTNIYSDTIKRNSETLMRQVAETMTVSLDNTIEVARELTTSPHFSSDIQYGLRSGSYSNFEQRKDSRFFLTFLNTLPISKYGTCMYSRTGKIMFSRMPTRNYNIFEEYYEDWKKEADSYEGSAIVSSIDNSSNYACAVLRTVIDTEDFENIGLVSVCISNSDFEEALERVHSIPGGRAIVLDHRNYVVYDSDQILQNESCSNDHVVEELSTLDGNYTHDCEGKIYSGISLSNPSKQYSVLVFTTQDELLREMKTTQKTVFFISICICLILFGIIILLSYTLTKPLEKITVLMKKVQNGDFSVRFKSRTKDEIGVLGDNFNLLLERLNSQIDDIIAINNKKNQMEIDILKSQINPHFMYNTLETIRMMAIESGNTEIEDMTKIFARIMRYNISSINEKTTVHHELMYIDDYLYIQNQRFHNRFDLEKVINGNLGSAELLKFTLQPIVENAMIHGLESTRSRGRIRIKVDSFDEFLRIVIEDDGVGIAADKLRAIQNNLLNSNAAKENKNIGLINVNSRIKLYYGDRYGLTIDSLEGNGTTVSIILPLMIKENLL